MKNSLPIIAAGLLALTSGAGAAPLYDHQQVVIGSSSASSMALDLDWLLVGDVSNDPNCVFRAHRLDYSDMTWDDPATEQFARNCGPVNFVFWHSRPWAGYGKSVAVEGPVAVMGAPEAVLRFTFRRDPIAPPSGRAEVRRYYEHTDTWQVVTTLDAEADQQEGAEYGAAVAVTEDPFNPGQYLVAVGAPGWNSVTPPANDAGKLYLYRYDGSTSDMSLLDVVEGGVAGGRFGHSLSADGSRIVGGHPGTPGSAHVLDWDGASLNHSLVPWPAPPPPLVFDNNSFGTRVALEDDELVVGDANDQAYTYRYRDGFYRYVHTSAGRGNADIGIKNDVALLGRADGIDLFLEPARGNPEEDIEANNYLRADIGDGRFLAGGTNMVVASSDSASFEAISLRCGEGRVLLSNVWYMVSMPCGSPDTVRVKDLFDASDLSTATSSLAPDPDCPNCADYAIGELRDDATRATRWVLWKNEDGVDQDYLLADDLVTLGTDQTYWLRTFQPEKDYVYLKLHRGVEGSLGKTITGPNLEVAPGLDSDIAGYQRHDLPAYDPGDVGEHWVMVGNPFGRRIQWADVAIEDGDGGPVTKLTDLAVHQNYLRTTAYTWWQTDPVAGSEAGVYLPISAVPGMDERGYVLPHEAVWIEIGPDSNGSQNLLLPLNK